MISTRMALLIVAGATFAACSNSGDDGGNAGTGAQSSGGALGSGQMDGSGGTSAGSGGGDSSAGSAGTNGRGGGPADGSAGTRGSGGASDAETGCNARTGGALIRFQIGSETLTVWITNDSFIAEAESLRTSGEQKIPSFALLGGTDCDPQWTWHVDPESAAFADVTIEVCDGLPSHIENDKPYWLETLGSYCPWSARVVSVDDRP